MTIRHLRNIPLKKVRDFLKKAGFKKIRTNGGHETWSRSGTNDRRPVTIQTHIDPVPKFILINFLSDFGFSKDDFFDILEGKKYVEKENRGKMVIYTIKIKNKK